MDTILDYKIIETIDEGVSTVIYRGYGRQDNKPYLIKSLKKEHPSLTDLAKLQHEFEITQSLNIKGIVNPYSLEKYNNSLVLILEDFSGKTLKNRIAISRFELLEFLKIAIQLAEILGDLQQNNIIHKDLKPQNIYFNFETEQVKVTNFSVASLLSRGNQEIVNPNRLEGTLAYMSPEQTGRMNRAIDNRTDLYSLGVTFYEMLTGQLPFQTTDAMELIHCHIAKQPPSPGELNRAIPEPISEIVMKLLSKIAEDRYKSGYGLKADLEICLTRLETEGKVDIFPLGGKDVSSSFRIPQYLYGREQEIIQLMAAFDRVIQGKSELVLVSGYSGIGKSALVNEIHKPIVREKGYFISGKFDQFQQNLPYSAIIRAFQELISQILTESEERIKIWKEVLLKALGPNGQIIIDVIPEVELVVGKQPPVQQLDSLESQNRFNIVFQQFVNASSIKEHPLVIFLDDLQWADAASLNLIKLLITDPDSQHLLLIGAYRSNEVNPAHPLMLTLEEIQQEGVDIGHLAVGPLGVAQVTQLISEAFQSEKLKVKPLAELVYQKTDGNPFFIIEFLKVIFQEKMIEFNPNRGDWNWNLNKIEEIEATDNVVELMAAKIQKCSNDTQNVLKLAACIGSKFDLKTLSTIYEKKPGETATHLQEALYEGLVLALGDNYKYFPVEDNKYDFSEVQFKFLHDRVQHAAYSLILESDKKEVHLKIGQLLLENIIENEREEKIFEIVNHFNFGANLITSQDSKLELARLNLIAGRKAKNSNAYEIALELFRVGLGLLAENSWNLETDLTFSLYIECAECEYINANFNEAEKLFDIILKNSKTNLEKIKVYIIKVKLYTNLSRYEKAVEIGLEGLKILGMNLAPAPNNISIMIEILKGKINLGRKKVENLVYLPEMTDPIKKATIRLLTNLSPAAYFTNQDLLALMALKAANLSMRYGNADVSALAYGIYSMILGSGLGDFKTGDKFGHLSLKLNSKFNNLSLEGNINFVFGTLVNHWRSHLNKSIIYLKEGFKSSYDSGDLIYAGYNIDCILETMIMKGSFLDDVYNESQKYLEFAKRIKIQHAIDSINIVEIYYSNLKGLAKNQLAAINDDFDVDKHINEEQLKTWYYLVKCQVSYLFENYTVAMKMIDELKKNLDVLFGLMTLTEYYFYYSLTLSANYFELTPQERKRQWNTLKKNQRKMKKWSENCPENFLHRYLIVAAEMARISGKDKLSVDLYDRAIESARENEYIQNEAIANELAAKFNLAKGNDETAKIYMMKARYGYLKWGANAKVKDLDEKYPQLLAQTITPSELTTAISSSSRLDLNTVMKAAQAISSEIVLERLLEKLMKIVIENAGAQKGFFIMDKEGELVIEAEGAVDKDDITVLQSVPVEKSQDLSKSIINYVARAKTNVVLNNAIHEGIFTQDAYISQNQPKSILCAPLVNQGKLIGMIYLENNLTTGAFTPDRLEVLNLLSSQAAISIENARLYDSSKVSEKKYRALFEESKDTIYITATNGQIIDINPAGLGLSGYSKEEIMKMNALDIYVYPEDRTNIQQELEAKKSVRDFEVKMRRKDGREIDCLITATLRQAPDGEILGYQGLVQDITDRKRSEQEHIRLAAINQELTLAYNIQESLLPLPQPDWPEGPEVICDNSPAREVGGDLYAYHDFTPSSGLDEKLAFPRKYALTIGDVSGKGMPAVLLMAVSLASFQSIVGQELSPSELLLHLDNSLAGYTLETRQNCAMVYAEIAQISPQDLKGEEDDSTYVIRVANAGCIWPIIKRVDGSVEWIKANGMPLGLGFSTQLGYNEKALGLSKGDLVILTSDGVVEATNTKDEMFSFERLEETVKSVPQHGAEAMLNHLKAEVAAFVGEAEQRDDVTIVVAQL